MTAETTDDRRPTATGPDVDDDRALGYVALAGIAAVVAGLSWLQPAKELGFDPAAVVSGVLSQLSTTLPAGILVLVAMTANVAAGATLVALLRRSPFPNVTEAALAGLAGTVALDAVLLFALGGPGWFRAPVLIAVHVAILAAGWLRRPIVSGPVPRPGAPRGLWAVVLLPWAGAVILQLASPVVPFLDVLPNHVAPVEHLRTFGEFASLDTMPSPIYGPSRAFLGYTALLGVAATMTGLPAVLAVSASILPQALLVALGVRRLGRALGGPGIEVWAILAFLLTASFGRLTDARANVLVLPLIFWVLARFAESTAADRADEPSVNDGRLIGLGLGAAILVHPLLGLFAAMTVAVLAVVAGSRAADVGVHALAITGAILLPQLATTIGIPLPAAAGLLVVPAAIAADVVVRRFAFVQETAIWIGWIVVLMAPPAAVVFADPVIRAALDGVGNVLQTMPLLVLAAIAGFYYARHVAGAPIVLAGLAVGAVVGMLAQLSSGNDVLGQTIRFELPKELDYWLPAVATVPAAIGLAAISRRTGLTRVARATAVGLFVVAAALPIRATSIDDHHRGEHRLSEALAVDFRWAGRGYWLNYPDWRRIVDAPRQALIDAVREQIAAGRIGPRTPVLHIASSFQQWVATPLGVFTGVIETVVSPDAVVEIHTIGGRLRPMADLPALLDPKAYPMLLLEPAGLDPPDLRPSILAAGYMSIAVNGQGELFARP